MLGIEANNQTKKMKFEMKWTNLKNFECPFPYCEATLINTLPEISCSRCSFKIDPNRFKGILSHRGGDSKTSKRFRWQNIVDGRCPECGQYLRKSTDGRQDFQKCINSECSFIIRENSLNQILADPTHPANKFYNRQHAK